jgi:hypothetical protein
VQRVFYYQNYSFTCSFSPSLIDVECMLMCCSLSDQWFLVMSTQLIGFSTGGITRRFLVSPPSMIWPAALVSCALFNTLHSEQYAGIGRLGGLSRERFFAYVFTGAFFWCMDSPQLFILCLINSLMNQTSSLVTCVRHIPCSGLALPIFICTVQALSWFSWVTWIRPNDPGGC